MTGSPFLDLLGRQEFLDIADDLFAVHQRSTLPEGTHLLTDLPGALSIGLVALAAAVPQSVHLGVKRVELLPASFGGRLLLGLEFLEPRLNLDLLLFVQFVRLGQTFQVPPCHLVVEAITLFRSRRAAAGTASAKSISWTSPISGKSSPIAPASPVTSPVSPVTPPVSSVASPRALLPVVLLLGILAADGRGKTHADEPDQQEVPWSPGSHCPFSWIH